MIKASISKLAAGEPLSRAEAHAAMLAIMEGEATPAQIASYITALRIRGETPDIIAGSVEAMREKSTPIKGTHAVIVDTCGTGGDGRHTFNVSTAAAFATAGAGVAVAKHGNKGVSSKCGSADVLEALGVNIAVTPERMAAALNEIGIAFLFAPALHPAMKHAIGPRREIGIRTIFNILGPLSNPAGANCGVLGVYDERLVGSLARAAAELGSRHVFVVHGADGLDEISTTAATAVAEVREGDVRMYRIAPEDVGLPRAALDDLAGGEPEDNARLLRDVLSGRPGAHRDIVLFNASAAIVAGGKAQNLSDGVKAAARSIDSGAAGNKLEALIAHTRAA